MKLIIHLETNLFKVYFNRNKLVISLVLKIFRFNKALRKGIKNRSTNQGKLDDLFPTI